MIELTLIIIISYLIGSSPTSLILGKVFKNIDIRDHGSRNAGMTNVYRVMGWKPAAIVGIVDITKGWFAAAIIPNYIESSIIDVFAITQIVAGFSAVMGHTFSVFSGFHGGKGVATLGGMLIALYPIALPICLSIFIISLILTGYVSVGSMSASISLALVVLLLPNFGFDKPAESLKIFSLLIPLFVIFTHRSNIGRLIRREENRFEKMMVFRRKK
jgi:glycerol-3-phosphate acyltransferase PlsY|tara:strand:+ start:30598 stop:31245 length:648 start_codon:yes stop_codon:yes gene_type:complete